MTRVQFFDLTQRVSIYAREHPRTYRLKVALMAALGHFAVSGG